MTVREILEKTKAGELSQEEAVLLLKDLKESAVKVTEYENGVFLVEMDDKKNRNMFSKELITGLVKTFTMINQNDSCKAVILTGKNNYFACGGNEEGLLNLYNGDAEMTDFGAYNLPLTCRVPVIAAMNGHAIGGGWCLGMFCDFVLFSEDSSYRCNHMKYGFTPGDGATYIFKEKLGVPLANEILYTGKTYKGKELRAKSVNVVAVPRKEVLSEAKKLADEIVQAPLQALILLKEQLTEKMKEQLEYTVEKEWDNQKKTLVNNPFVLRNILGTFDSKKTVSEVELLSEQVKENAKKVFWIHDGDGNVLDYRTVANALECEFYGIKLTRYEDGDIRFSNIQILANTYLEQIKEKQKKGPYRLGGYSIGGLIAYEIARQFQMLGEEVESLVMIETPVPERWMGSQVSDELFMHESVNRTLLGRNQHRLEEVEQFLIRPEEVTENDYLTKMVKIGKERGLSQTLNDDALIEQFKEHSKMKKQLFFMKTKILPLPYPNKVKSYHILNVVEEYYGSLKSFFMENSPMQLGLEDAQGYWKEKIDDLIQVQACASCSFTALHEPLFVEMVVDTCSGLYKNMED